MSTIEWRKKADAIYWYDLTPMYYNAKSYYGKAEVEEIMTRLERPDGGYDYITIWNLYSYKKNVARIVKVNDTYNPICFGKYSRTTTRHQKEFFHQYGFDEEELPIIMKQELTEDEINRL